MKKFLMRLFRPQTYRTPAELTTGQYLLFRSINNFERTTLREWRTR